LLRGNHVYFYFWIATVAYAFFSMETYTWPDPTDALKDQDYQPVGNDAGASTLAPGHTDVAEWLPIAYHDKTTAYIEAETGDGASRCQTGAMAVYSLATRAGTPRLRSTRPDTHLPPNLRPLFHSLPE
jgi:hypothetical protein